jgi:hypothetical protein
MVKRDDSLRIRLFKSAQLIRSSVASYCLAGPLVVVREVFVHFPFIPVPEPRNEKSRRGRPPEGFPPRRLTDEQAARHCRAALYLVFQHLQTEQKRRRRKPAGQGLADAKTALDHSFPRSTWGTQGSDARRHSVRLRLAGRVPTREAVAQPIVFHATGKTMARSGMTRSVAPVCSHAERGNKVHMVRPGRPHPLSSKPPDDDGDILAAEAKAVVQCLIAAGLAGGVGHVVEVAVGIGVLIVDRRRQDVVADG